MKLIISRGKFGVSPEALKRLIARGSKAVWTLDKKKLIDGDDSIKLNFESSVDIGDGYKLLNMDGFILRFVAIYKDEESCIYSARLERSCPIFIGIVEEMGEEASDFGCLLEVVEIPDNIPECIDLDPDDNDAEEQRICWLLENDDEGNERVIIRKVELVNIKEYQFID
jgi:hypothetical protein